MAGDEGPTLAGTMLEDSESLGADAYFAGGTPVAPGWLKGEAQILEDQLGLDELFLPGVGTSEAEEAWTGSELESDEMAADELEDLMTAEDQPQEASVDTFEAAITYGEDQYTAGETTVAYQVAPQVAPGGGGAAAVATQVTFSVRTDFAVRRSGRLEFDWRPGESVRGARVEIVGSGVSGVTSGAGLVRLATTGLPDGDHIARITHSDAVRNVNTVAGPNVADGLATPRPSRIYRQLDVRIRLRGGLIDGAWLAAGDTHGGIGNRRTAVAGPRDVPVDWKPVWMSSPMKPGERMRTSGAIDAIVVHHTGGPVIGPAINTFVNPNTVANAHYLIDRNGHVIKTAEDLRRANQAGYSRWGGRLGVSNFTIGIEIVHRDGPYPAAQMQSLVLLLTSLRAAYPSIAAHRIVGHSDIATSQGAQTLLSDRRAEDPGIEFDWRTLEAAGLGMIPRPLAALPSMVSSFFRLSLPGPAVLREGDHDPRGSTPAKLGGVSRPGFTGTPIRDVQDDLEHIGYSVRPVGGALGTFDLHTRKAVDRFQRHFFAGTRQALRAGRLGRVDFVTAVWIKAVRAGVP